jgi:hypothetical protein
VPWCGRKEYVTEKPSDTTWNRSRTFRLVAQRLNHYATPGPNVLYTVAKNEKVASYVFITSFFYGKPENGFEWISLLEQKLPFDVFEGYRKLKPVRHKFNTNSE